MKTKTTLTTNIVDAAEKFFWILTTPTPPSMAKGNSGGRYLLQKTQMDGHLLSIHSDALIKTSHNASSYDCGFHSGTLNNLCIPRSYSVLAVRDLQWHV